MEEEQINNSNQVDGSSQTRSDREYYTKSMEKKE
jgi:hypothetical protein